MITDHAYEGELRSGASCQYVYTGELNPETDRYYTEVCARQAMEHEVTPALNIQVAEEKSFPFHRIKRDGEAVVASALDDLGKVMDSTAYRNPGMKPSAPEAPGDSYLNQALVRAADAAQYARPAIPAEQRGQIRVRLLNATPDPLGSVAALIAQYSGRVIRSLAEVTDEERRSALTNMSKTVLSGPLEAVQFHWQIEGVTRSITHQMVRSRASFFAQESLRFAVPEGDWWKEIPRPPWLSKAEDSSPSVIMWKRAMIQAQQTYEYLLDQGCPAEEARGVLPHDMPTRIHWVCDLRTLLAEAGKRTCTQAQFTWRMIFAGMASALRTYDGGWGGARHDLWQWREIANALRPVCFQTGKCGFMAQFDRSCSIRARVDDLGERKIPPSDWNNFEALKRHVGPTWPDSDVQEMLIADYEWAADPGAARS